MRLRVDVFAFDFDGVVCDSAVETAKTAWRAAAALSPGRFEGEMPADILATFCRCRPVIETGYQNLVLLDLIDRGTPESEILGDFEAMCSAWIRSSGLGPEDLKGYFGAARDGWINDGTDSWIAAQGFYPGVVEAVNALSADRHVVTTKQHRFTMLLAGNAGLEIPEHCIHALESFEGGSKRDVILSLQARTGGGHRVRFFEDRLPTLEGMTDLDGVDLYLVDWGYNTAQERAIAGAHDRIALIDSDAFEALLSRH